MTGRVEGKIALVTGAARGQGRSHAVRLAHEGADVIVIDMCEDVATSPYPMATTEDLQETERLVKAEGRQVVSFQADVRKPEQLSEAIDAGVSQLGRLDIVCANAGVISFGSLDEIEEQAWRDVIDTNLTGVWHTTKAVTPHLRAAGGGSIVITSSVLGLIGMAGVGHYAAAKHGLIGLMRTLALELAADKIRVNTVNPTNVKTDMLINPAVFEVFAPDLPVEQRTLETMEEYYSAPILMQIPWVESSDVSNAVLFLASDEARYVTGIALPVDGGNAIK